MNYDDYLSRFRRGFSTLANVGQMKRAYQKLAMRLHPDRGGDTEAFKALQSAYHEALQGQHQRTETDSRGEEHTYYYNRDREQSVMDKISAILALNLDGIEINLIGTWVWVTGDTRPNARKFRQQLKLSWHSRREAWYWHPPQRRRTRYNANASLSDLAASYGSRSFRSGRNDNGSEIV